MSIIEKFGITPGPWSYCESSRKISNEDKYNKNWESHKKDAAICKIMHREPGTDNNNETMSANAKLIAAAPEMLEALILMMDEAEKLVASGARKGQPNPYLINIIEKACYPKTWAQIKELLWTEK